MKGEIRKKAVRNALDVLEKSLNSANEQGVFKTMESSHVCYSAWSVIKSVVLEELKGPVGGGGSNPKPKEEIEDGDE